ncbi:MAG TPA: MGMT family protein, partial [Methylomirabilota bacterium]|nr:MGMT family protein [Methylomirabilota bacterium]
RGQVATYGQIAAWLGFPRHARMVGHALRSVPSGVPWHRVVNARGGISRRAAVGSVVTQRILLEQEGVRLHRGRVALARHGWEGPMRRRPRWDPRPERRGSRTTKRTYGG